MIFMDFIPFIRFGSVGQINGPSREFQLERMSREKHVQTNSNVLKIKRFSKFWVNFLLPVWSGKSLSAECFLEFVVCFLRLSAANQSYKLRLKIQFCVSHPYRANKRKIASSLRVAEPEMSVLLILDQQCLTTQIVDCCFIRRRLRLFRNLKKEWCNF